MASADGREGRGTTGRQPKAAQLCPQLLELNRGAFYIYVIETWVFYRNWDQSLNNLNTASQNGKLGETVNKVPWRGLRVPYRIQNQSFLCGRKRLVSSPASHTDFPGRPDGFPNISSPSPPDLGVKGKSRVAC